MVSFLQHNKTPASLTEVKTLVRWYEELIKEHNMILFFLGGAKNPNRVESLCREVLI